MADLDDFFAKKDRKKSKSKKLIGTEELAKKSTAAEDTTSKKSAATAAVELNVDSNAAPTTTIVDQTSTKNDDEWKDFEEEERKDYTGLKIGVMTINDDESNTGTDGEGVDIGSDGELNADNLDGRSGPWKKMAENAPTATEAVPAVAEKQTASKVYISPAMRMAQEQQKTRLKKGVLPDIHNQEYFPVLGSAKPEEVKKKKPDPGFEEVKHGGRVQRSQEMSSNAPVSIGNRWESLADS